MQFNRVLNQKVSLFTFFFSCSLNAREVNFPHHVAFYVCKLKGTLDIHS